MGTIITRIGYCPTCFERHQPKSSQKFLAFGSTSNCFVLRETKWRGEWGFTPHTYWLEKSLPNREVLIKKCCGMEDCGVYSKVEVRKGEDWNVYYFKLSSAVEEIWTREQWNGLVMLKQNHFSECYQV